MQFELCRSTAEAGFSWWSFREILPCVLMALWSAPYASTRGRTVEEGTQFHSITNSKLFFEISPNSIASVGVPGQADVRSGSWASYRQSKLEVLYNFRTTTRPIVIHSGAATSGSWASDRQSQLEVLHNFRTTRRVIVVQSGAAPPGLSPRALQGGARAPRRLVDFVRAIPKISRAYFRSPFRRALYGGISLLGGFYVAHTISLSFGALGINDVIAAAFSVLLVEYVTKYYHTRPQMTFTVALINNFKIGFTYGLFIDAFKIAS